ncbi:hypothetical protein MYA_2403 [Burkholderia sp. KJ006]|nr:hypothetical protein MYA_2403 [Burkholderia sp. KJ006]
MKAAPSARPARIAACGPNNRVIVPGRSRRFVAAHRPPVRAAPLRARRARRPRRPQRPQRPQRPLL